MPTTLIAIRHAEPEPSGGYAEDSLRPLAEKGKAVQHTMSRRLKREGLAPSKVVTSPFLRAQQTAEILASTFDIPLETSDALATKFNGETLLNAIPRDTTTIFVGHAPTLAFFVNMLCGSEALTFGLSKSGTAVVTFDDDVAFGAGRLQSYFKP